MLSASENWPWGFWSSSRVLPTESTNTPTIPSLNYSLSPGLELSLVQLRAFEEWERIIKTYSSTLLTKDTDRLTALSGVASTFAASQGYEPSAYVAGMWRETLELSLFWIVNTSAFTEEAQQLSSHHYIAPSFSWPSIMRGVEFAWEKTIIRVPRPHFHISRVHLRYDSTNKFGAVLEGSHVVVIGPTWNVSWQSLNPTTVALKFTTILKLRGLRNIFANMYLDHQAWYACDEDLFCISAGDDYNEGKSESTIRSRSWTPRVLILLKPWPKYGLGAFRRIGLATHVRKSVESYPRYEPVSLMHSNEDASAISNVEYRPDSGEHVIKI